MDMAKPIIRFKGYQDDWEQRKVCNITTSYSGGTPKSGYTEYYDGDIPFIRSGEIYSDKTELFITELGMKNSSAKMVHEGDILYALYGATSGEVSRAKLDGAINQAILAIVPNDDINANFLVEWFRKEKDKITDTYLQGGQGNLSAQIIKELEVTIPSYDEQNKIGLYFEQLNTLITLHQRKCDETKRLKKYMLQKMFPQNGEKVPEIRFSGFTDDWEQRKFGDVGSVAMCKRIFKEQTSDEGEVPFYKIGTFGGVPDAFISRELFDEYKVKYPYPNKGDILISASGSIGRTVEFTGKNEYFQDSNIVWFKHGNEIDNSFLKVLYSVIEWSCEGSTIKRLYNDNFLKTEFMLPQIDEQKKIGTYFSTRDHLITLHQRELENLQNIKKFMLGKMFV